MSLVLEGLEHFSMACLDNILVFSHSSNEHFKHLQTVFGQLRKHRLKIKQPKCQFKERNLGFIIDRSGMQSDIDKVEVTRAIPEPRTVKKVFFRAIGYYRMFIPAFSRLGTPLIA